MEAAMGEVVVLLEFRANKQDAAVLRDCLACRKPFKSAGAHNRICNQCKEDADDELPPELGGTGGIFCR
jgi:hypothetical protein